MTWAPNVPFPFGLHHGNTSHGYFKTAGDAKAAHMSLTASMQVRSAIHTPTNQELRDEQGTGSENIAEAAG